MPVVKAPRRLVGHVEQLLSTAATERYDFQSRAVETLVLEFEGIAGERHRGWTRKADARVPYLERGTVMRNTRHLSLVSIEDCAEVARRLEITHLDPSWLGGNIVVSGLPHFSFLPRFTKLLFPGGAILTVEDQNPPCTKTGEAIAAAHLGRADIRAAFPKVAKGLRGVVATVEHPGTLSGNTDFTARLPEQWIYA